MQKKMESMKGLLAKFLQRPAPREASSLGARGVTAARPVPGAQLRGPRAPETAPRANRDVGGAAAEPARKRVKLAKGAPARPSFARMFT